MLSSLLLITGVFIFLACLFVLIGNIIINLYTRVPYAPTPKNTIEKILDLIHVRPGERLYDLGAGDGRVLFAAEKRGARARGFELSPFSYIRTAVKIKLTQSRAQIFFKNFFFADLGDADIIFCFLVGAVMLKLEKKLQKELKPGAMVISYGFSFPGWKPAQIITPEENKLQSGFSTPLYIYKKIS